MRLLTLAPVRQARALMLTPHLREVETARRGFYPWSEGPSIVEPVGKAFVNGFRLSMLHAHGADINAALRAVPLDYQGFAAEGAGMATAIRGRLEPWNRDAFEQLVASSGARHSYMMHVGLGWALARLPRVFWPDLTRLDPLVGPLVADGYGFHEVFFKTRDTLDGGVAIPSAKAWPAPTADASQQVMQGVGRGLWFVSGGRPPVVQDLIDSFDALYHASLWAGVGLAATYAGGRGPEGLRALVVHAGSFLPWLRQGCAFAAEARDRAEITNAHTALAVQIICAQDMSTVLSTVARTRPPARQLDNTNWHLYETWREDLALELAR